MNFIVIKTSMGYGDDIGVLQAYTWARQLGFIVGLYHWIDGTALVSSQVTRFSKWIDALKPDFTAMDHEQWWSDWNQYWLYCANKLTYDQVKKLPPTTIDSVASGFMNSINNIIISSTTQRSAVR